MAAKVKKTAKKTAKKAATSKSAAKTAKKPKAAAKAKAEPKKAASAKKAPAKVAKKAPAAKKVAKKAAAKEPKAKKGLLNKIVGKLTPKKAAEKPAKAAVEKAPRKEAKAEKPVKEKAPAKVKVEAPAEVVVKSSQKNVAELTQEFTDKKAAVEVLLTDAEGRVLCKFNGCDEIANVEGYCRYHYLLNWKRIQLKKKILSEGKLEKYINELTAKYPDKYIEMLKGDLKSEKDFLSVVNELEIDDSDNGMSDDEEDNYIEQEVQGVSGNKRSNDDDY